MTNRVALIVSLCLLMPSMSTVAHADTTTDLARWLDSDAAVVIRTEPQQIERAAQRATWLGVPGAARALQISNLLSSGGLGADLLTKRGWHDAGFDANAPILMAIAAVNAPAMARALESTRAGRPMAPPMWRSRAVLRVRDSRRLGYLIKMAALIAPMLSGVSTVETPLMARVLKASVMQSMRLAGELKRRGVIAVGYVEPLQSLVFVIRRGNTLIIDVLGTLDGVRPTWRRMRSRILSVLDRAPGRLSRQLSSGAAATLRKSGTTVWVNAVRTHDAMVAFRSANLLSMFRAGVVGRDRLRVLPSACTNFRAVATRGPFKDLAVRSVLGPASGLSQTVWGMRTLFKMSAPFIIQNDQLPMPAIRPGGPVATGALFIRGLGPIRAVPRPKVLQSSLIQVWRDATLCGTAARTTLTLFAWPQLLGLFLDDLAKVNKDASVMVDGMRNGAFAVRKLSWQLKGLHMTASASGTKPAIAAATRALRMVFGQSTHHKTKHGPTTTWGTGPMRPFAFRTVMGKQALGMSLPASGIARYLAAPPAPPHGARGIVGTFSADLSRLLPDLVPGYTGRYLATKLQRVTSELEVTPETIVVSTRVSFAP